MPRLVAFLIGIACVYSSIAFASHSGLFFGQRIHKLTVDSSGIHLWTDGSIPKDCMSYISPPDKFHSYQGQTGDGVYWIKPAGSAPFQIFCDMTTDGGGYMVFQNRISNSVDFYQNWAAYKSGFGSIGSGTTAGNYWLGNDKINLITATNKTLYVRLKRAAALGGAVGFAKYNSFSLGSAASNYTLSVGGYSSGNVGDSFTAHNGFQFSTYDADHDTSPSNCAISYLGAWWYSNCHSSNLNGHYYNGSHSSYADGMEWYAWTGYYESMAETRMMVK